jgi:hypothetical protein
VVALCLTLVPFAFSDEGPWPWTLSLILALPGLALLIYGYVVSARFDPNAGDPEHRKALGRTCAIWGEGLNDVLARSPDIAGPGTRK